MSPEDMKDKAQYVLKRYNEAKTALQTLNGECRLDDEYYFSKQWNDADAAEMVEEGRPTPVINLLKKNVDLISGYERQNRMDIGVLPMEGGDEVVSEALSRLLKWILSHSNHDVIRSDAFKSSTKKGLSWLYVSRDLEHDHRNGTLRIKLLSNYDVLYDPQMTEKDLSDCGYLSFSKDVHLEKLMFAYPRHAQALQSLHNEPRTDDFRDPVNDPLSRDRMVTVIEHWERKTVRRIVVFDPQEPSKKLDFESFDDPALIQLLSENPHLSTVKKKVRKIHLTVLAGDSLVLYDGAHPDDIDEYPFVPIFFFYDQDYMAHESWSLKVQGIIRSLRSLQDGKNKTASLIQEGVNIMIHNAWLMEEGSVDDTGPYESAVGSGDILKYNRGQQAPQQIKSPEIPQSIFMNDQQNTDHIREVGMNPDSMGMLSEKGMSAVGMRTRQRQALTVIQEPFDNLSLAMKLLGTILVKMIGRWYSKEKVKRILGEDLPFPTDKMKQKQRQQIAEMEQRAAEQGMMMRSQLEEMAQGDVEQAQQASEQLRMMLQQQMEQIEAMKQDMVTQEQAEVEFWAAFDTISFGTFEYDCVIDESSSSPTARLASYMALEKLAQTGAPVPPGMIIQLSEIPHKLKQELLANIQAQQQAAEQQRQEELELKRQQIQVQMMQAYAGAAVKGAVPQGGPGEGRETSNQQA